MKSSQQLRTNYTIDDEEDTEQGVTTSPDPRSDRAKEYLKRVQQLQIAHDKSKRAFKARPTKYAKKHVSKGKEELRDQYQRKYIAHGHDVKYRKKIMKRLNIDVPTTNLSQDQIGMMGASNSKGDGVEQAATQPMSDDEYIEELLTAMTDADYAHFVTIWHVQNDDLVDDGFAQYLQQGHNVAMHTLNGNFKCTPEECVHQGKYLKREQTIVRRANEKNRFNTNHCVDCGCSLYYVKTDKSFRHDTFGNFDGYDAYKLDYPKVGAKKVSRPFKEEPRPTVKEKERVEEPGEATTTTTTTETIDGVYCPKSEPTFDPPSEDDSPSLPGGKKEIPEEAEVAVPLLQGHNLTAEQLSYMISNHMYGDADSAIVRSRKVHKPTGDVRMTDAMGVRLCTRAIEIEEIQFTGVHESFCWGPFPRMLQCVRGRSTWWGVLRLTYYLWRYSFSLYGLTLLLGMFVTIPTWSFWWALVTPAIVSNVLSFVGTGPVFWGRKKFVYVPHIVTMMFLGNIGKERLKPSDMVQNWLQASALNMRDQHQTSWFVASAKCAITAIEFEQGFRPCAASEESQEQSGAAHCEPGIVEYEQYQRELEAESDTALPIGLQALSSRWDEFLVAVSPAPKPTRMDIDTMRQDLPTGHYQQMETLSIHAKDAIRGAATSVASRAVQFRDTALSQLTGRTQQLSETVSTAASAVKYRIQHRKTVCEDCRPTQQGWPLNSTFQESAVSPNSSTASSYLRNAKTSTLRLTRKIVSRARHLKHLIVCQALSSLSPTPNQNIVDGSTQDVTNSKYSVAQCSVQLNRLYTTLSLPLSSMSQSSLGLRSLKSWIDMLDGTNMPQIGHPWKNISREVLWKLLSGHYMTTCLANCAQTMSISSKVYWLEKIRSITAEGTEPASPLRE